MSEQALARRELSGIAERPTDDPDQAFADGGTNLKTDAADESTCFVGGGDG